MSKKVKEKKEEAVVEPSGLQVDIKSLDELVLKDEAILIDEALNDDGKMLWTIAKVGITVDKYAVGDLVYQLASEHSATPFSGLDKNFILTDMYNIKLAVRKGK